MRIVVSPYWNKTLKILMFIDVLLLVVSIFLILYFQTIDILVAMIGYTLIIVLISSLLMYYSRRLLTKVTVTNNLFIADLFGKTQCSIDKSKKIYYMIFRCSESVYSSQNFILISNSYFEYKADRSFFSKQLISYYDLNKQILMPYNSETLSLCDFENWINIKD